MNSVLLIIFEKYIFNHLWTNKTQMVFMLRNLVIEVDALKLQTFSCSALHDFLCMSPQSNTWHAHFILCVHNPLQSTC